MSDTLTAKQYQTLYGVSRNRSVVELKPDKDDRGARLRGHLRAMSAYYDIPKDKTEEAIKAHADYSLSIAENLITFAKVVGIEDGPASFYTRQQELSRMI